MDGNQKHCMGVIFLLINKIKAIDAIKAAGGTVQLGEPASAPSDAVSASSSSSNPISPQKSDSVATKSTPSTPGTNITAR